MSGMGSIIKKLKEGDIILISEKGLKHSLNRALGRSRWHHIMLYIGQGRVLEATPRKGCHISKLDLTKECYLGFKALRHAKINDLSRRKIAATAVRIFLGRKFDWWQLIKVFFRRQLVFMGNNGRACRPGYKCNFGSVICSNLVAMSYHLEGCSIGDKWAPEYVMPRDYDKLEKSGEFDLVFERKFE